VVRLRFGQVVFVRLDDGHGARKIRPAIIITDDSECNDGGVLQVGNIADDLMEKILDTVNRLCDDDSFDCWQ